MSESPAFTLAGLLFLAGIDASAKYIGLHSSRDDFHASLEMAAAGLGAALVPELALRNRPAGVVVLDVPEIRLARNVFALLINASFDVFIEGPMGGTWFWAIYGAGLGAMIVYRKNPHALNTVLMTGPDGSDQPREALRAKATL